MSVDRATQVKLLVKRNVLIKRFQLVQTIVSEMIFPVFFFGMVVMMKSLMNVTEHDVVDMPSPIPMGSWLLDEHLIKGRLLYAPQNCDDVLANNSDIDAVMASIRQQVSPDHQERVVRLHNEQQLEDMYEDTLDHADDRTFAGVVFDTDCSGTLSANVSYALRLDSAQLANTASSAMHVTDAWQFSDNDDRYMKSGFLVLESLVDAALLDLQANRHSGHDYALNVTYSRFPVPQHTFDPFYQYMAAWAGLYVIMGFMAAGSMLVGAVVWEKEMKTKIYMQSMGVTEATYYLSWYITYSLVLLVPVTLITIMEAASSIFRYTNSGWLFLVTLLFAQAFIWLCFVMSSLFSRSKTASSAVGILLFIFYTPFFIPAGSAVTAALCSLSAPVAFGYAFQAMFDADFAGDGISWSNLSGSDETVLSFAWCLFMLLLDTCLYALLTWYLSLVVPSEVGVARPWHFPVSRCFQRRRQSIASPVTTSTHAAHETDFEPVSDDMKPYISIKNLMKSFPSSGNANRSLRACCHPPEEFLAVDGLSLDCYKGQILALLGHNGAGKSTTLSILTGLLSPSGGSVTINGRDLWLHLDEIRSDVGVCPQSDVLFDALTTRQHLEFYGALKGVPPEEVQALVDQRLEQLDLHEHEHTVGKKMSGGQKRKLSVLIAMIGNPSVLFLDEPTSGMDPFSRRKLWDMLHEYKQDRVMILTTHFMDEADLLGDRVAIMSKGQLRCVGSSMFLKKRFGIGYHLHVNPAQSHEREHQERLKDLVQEVVPGARRDDNNDASFVLPLTEVSRFSDLFRSLEESSAVLAVESYGVSLTSLEEVFLNLAEQEEEESKNKNAGADEESDEPPSMRQEMRISTGDSYGSLHIDTFAASNIANVNENLLTMAPSRWQQFRGQVVKRFRVTKRDLMSLYMQVFFPLVYVIIVGATSGNYAAPVSKLPPLSFLPPDSTVADAPFSVGGNSTASVPLVHTLDAMGDLRNVLEAPFQEDMTEWQQWLLDAYDREEVFASVMTSEWGSEYSHVTLASNRSTPHATPTALNAVSRAAAAQFQADIDTTNRPLPSSVSFDSVPVESWVVPMMLGLAFLMAPMGYGVTLVKEVNSGAKHQQLVMGLPPLLYWLSNLVFDVACFGTTVVLCVVVFLAMGVSSLIGKNLLGTSVLLLVYVFSIMCLCYLLTLPFTKPTSFQGLFSVATMLVGMGLYAAALATQVSTGKTNIVASIFMWYPPFGLMWGLNKLIVLEYNRPVDASLLDALAWDQLGAVLFAMFACGVVCVVLTIAIDLGLLRRARDGLKQPAEHYEKEDDVQAEEIRVKEDSCHDSIRLRNVYKSFPQLNNAKEDKVVVNDVSLGIRRGEIFGLLGPNGAGKTTIMRMLTAEHRPSGGALEVEGCAVPAAVNHVYPKMGFCPQDEGLMELLTGKEHLELYATIKGIPRDIVPQVVNSYLDTMYLTPHTNKLSKAYSGGNKRKLNVAISLMGAPSVLLLDEPSTGIDPQARRHLWDAISAGTPSRSCVLTTHSMEEADALCDRIGIMVNGSMQCIGTGQHLKSKYGQGYEIEVKVSPTLPVAQREAYLESVVRVLEDVAGDHQGHVVLLEQFGAQLKLSVRNGDGAADVPLWVLFRVLEEQKSQLGIDDYSVSQTTLEQVFLRFAREQEDTD